MSKIHKDAWIERANGSYWRCVAYSVTGVVSVALITGCSQNDLGPWQEEVLLSDGRTIVVERYETFDVSRPIGDVGSAFVAAAKVKIVGPPDLANVPELTMSYRPIVLDYDSKGRFWFVIGVNERACGPEALRAGHMNEQGLVNIHPNFEFQLIDGAWRAAEIGPERLGLPANLLIQRTTIDKFAVLPLEEKARVDSDFGVPQYLRTVEARIGCG